MTAIHLPAPALADGAHRLTPGDLALPALHPLRNGGPVIELQVATGVVTACRFDVAGAHRGDEKLLEVRDVRQGLALICRHAWLTAPFAETAYARAVEAALGIMLSPRAAALRELVLALHALATDLLWEHLDTGAAAALRMRERALDAIEAITGARMHTTYARIGGVAADIDATDLAAADALLIGLPPERQQRLREAVAAVATSEGAISVQLPKVLRIPKGETLATIDTPHGDCTVWVVGGADKVPLRVHITHAAYRALARLEREAVGMPVQEFLHAFTSIRFVPTEVAR